MSVELVDADAQLPMSYRNTIANMMAEAEASNGIFAQDRGDRCLVRRARASTDLPYPRVVAGGDARYEIDEELSLTEIVPMIAQAVQPRQRVSGRGGRARAPHVRQGADRFVHQRQLRRPAAGGAA